MSRSRRYQILFLMMLIYYGRWVYYDTLCSAGYGPEQHNPQCREQPLLLPDFGPPRLPGTQRM